MLFVFSYFCLCLIDKLMFLQLSHALKLVPPALFNVPPDFPSPLAPDAHLLPIILRQDKEKHFVMIVPSLIARFPPIFSNRNEVFCDKRQRLLLNLNFFEFVTIDRFVFLDFATIFFNVILLLKIYVGITGVNTTPIFNR